jgi:hypothetical protein
MSRSMMVEYRLPPGTSRRSVVEWICIRRNQMFSRIRAVLALALAGAAIWMARMPAQQTQRFLYAALPGVGGGNNLKYGGAGILVFDIDHGHTFVRRILLQGVTVLHIGGTR